MCIKYSHNCFVDNKITRFVILNKVKNLFHRNGILSSFLGQMLRFTQHDSLK
jgi:hypothetical protein